MRRTKLVLAALAVMVAMLVVFSAPALADKNNNKNNNNNHGDRNNNNNDVAFVVNDGFNRFHDDDINFRHGGDVEIDLDNDFGFDNDDHFISGFSGFSPFFGLGCWEWSWVFERWEWECD
jgi:hypothetical protein